VYNIHFSRRGSATNSARVKLISAKTQLVIYTNHGVAAACDENPKDTTAAAAAAAATTVSPRAQPKNDCRQGAAAALMMNTFYLFREGGILDTASSHTYSSHMCRHAEWGRSAHSLCDPTADA